MLWLCRTFAFISCLPAMVWAGTNSFPLRSSDSPTIEFVDNRLLLSSKVCIEGNATVNDLSKWLKNMGQSNSNCKASKVATRNSDKNSCTFDITECVPEHVLRYHGLKPHEDGPNCWNLALVMKGILPSFRFTSPAEMTFYTKPPLCEQLRNNDIRQPGDLGEIRTFDSDGNVKEVHGFIYVSDHLVYSKNSIVKQDAYALQEPEAMYKMYKVPTDPECRANEINPSLKDKCPNAVAFFRCQSMQEYLSKISLKNDPILTLFQKVTSFEGCIHNQAFHGDPLPEPAQKGILDSIAALNQYLKQEIVQRKNSKSGPQVDKDFLIGSLALRLNAIQEQLKGNERNGTLSDALDTPYGEIVKSAKQLGITTAPGGKQGPPARR